MLEATLYYPFHHASGVRLEAGVAARNYDGELAVLASSPPASQAIESTLPQLHVAATTPFRLVSENAYLGAEINGIYLHDDQAGDFSLFTGWRSDFLLGLEVGFNQMFIQLDEDSQEAVDLKFGGPYLALTLNF